MEQLAADVFREPQATLTSSRGARVSVASIFVVIMRILKIAPPLWWPSCLSRTDHMITVDRKLALSSGQASIRAIQLLGECRKSWFSLRAPE